MKRNEARDIAIKVLYQSYIFDDLKYNYDLSFLIKQFIEEDNEFIKQLVFGVRDNLKSIEKMANKYLENWTIDRLSKVDRAILSLAIYELLYTDTPKVVAINEAIELSKGYSDEKVIKMINASLDKILHNEVKQDG